MLQLVKYLANFGFFGFDFRQFTDSQQFVQSCLLCGTRSQIDSKDPVNFRLWVKVDAKLMKRPKIDQDVVFGIVWGR